MEKKENFFQKAWKYAKANPIVVMLVIVAIIVGITKKNFFSWSNFGNLMSNTAVRFLIALGVSGCLITKGTDLSAGRQVGLAACLAGILIQRGDYASRLTKLPQMNMFVVLLIVVALGAVIGMVNGLIITKLHVPPFIATLGTQKYLTKDLPATSVWKLEKFTVGGEEVLVKGAPTAIARGTELRGEIDEAGEYYEAEVASKPDLYFKAWKYPSISNTVTFARGAERVYSSDEFANRIVLAGAFMSKTNDVDLIHWQVYQEDKFDPRTAWMNKGEQSSTSTRAFTARDEFMAMAFYVHEGVLDRADLVATKQRPREQIWSEYVTNPLSADSDGDEVPDGWELYTMAGPKKYNKDTKDREGFNGPRSAYRPVVKFDAEHQDKDGDGLTIAGEFNAIDTVAD